MEFRTRGIVAAIALTTASVLNSVVAPQAYAQQSDTDDFRRGGFCENRLNGDIFARTELFFGLSKPDGSKVTNADFQDFVDEEVTPRFPEGLTVLTGRGQFEETSGTVIKEGSKVLILLYTFSNRSNRDIDEVREAYKYRFQQQSVLRVDSRSCVSF